jgi:hypothetical protein
VGARTFRAKKYRMARVVGTGDRKSLEFESVGRYVRTHPDTGEMIPVWRMAKAVLKFAWLRHKARHQVDSPNFWRIDERPDLCVPFETWLAKNGISELRRMFEIPVPMMGYGLLDEIVTPYVLRYMDGGTFRNLILRGLPLVGLLSRWPRRFRLGFQRMWQDVAAHLNVRLDVRIERIRRTATGPRPIEIRLSHPDQIFHGQELQQVTLYFDKLILACPLTPDVLVQQLDLDLREDELGVFERVQTYSFCHTTLHAVKVDAAGEEVPYELPAPVVPVAPFDRESIGRPWVMVQLWGKRSRLLQIYSRIDPQEWGTRRFEDQRLASDQELAAEDKGRAIVIERAERLLGWLGAAVAGTTNPHFRRWRTFDRWPYFGHVGPADFEKGFFRKLEALQGKYLTYYAGGVTTFELVEGALRSAKHIVEKLDADERRTAAR